METEFTPWSGLIGGVMIGVAALALLWLNGRLAGVSGILGSAMTASGGERHWRAAFLLGLLLGGGIGLYTLVGRDTIYVSGGLPLLALAGLLVGYGTRLGSGCTSGHGVCGIGRLSPRSLVATGIFMATAIVVVYVKRHLLGV